MDWSGRSIVCCNPSFGLWPILTFCSTTWGTVFCQLQSLIRALAYSDSGSARTICDGCILLQSLIRALAYSDVVLETLRETLIERLQSLIRALAYSDTLFDIFYQVVL